MKKLLMLVLVIVFGYNISSALEPVAVSIIKTDNNSAVAVTVELNNYTSGTAANVLPSTSMGSLTPNSSGVISFVVDGTAWEAIAASSVNSYYVLDVKVDGTLYAQYRLDELVALSSAAEVEAAKTYEVGDLAQGGYVFYVTPDGKHGLACQLQDYGSAIDLSTAENNANNPDYLDDDGDNYTNWRVPTLYELELLYNQRIAIGGFSNVIYKSSTTNVFNADATYVLDFNSATDTSELRTYSSRIRYVRSF